MNEYLERARAYLKEQLEKRSARERWMMVAAAAGLLAVFVEVSIVSPLREAVAAAEADAERLEGDIQRAARLAPQLQRLESEIELVAQRIQPGRETDLLRVLEQLAAQAQIKDRLESIRPKTPSKNERYPESRVEVQLRGATLAQTVQFLYSIESAPLYLIVRSVNIKSRQDDSQLLDVNFSVSSFQRT